MSVKLREQSSLGEDRSVNGKPRTPVDADIGKGEDEEETTVRALEVTKLLKGKEEESHKTMVK